MYKGRRLGLADDSVFSPFSPLFDLSLFLLVMRLRNLPWVLLAVGMPRLVRDLPPTPAPSHPLDVLCGCRSFRLPQALLNRLARRSSVQ